MRKITGAAAVTLLVVMQSATAAVATTPRAFDGGALKRRPATIIYTGDGSGLLAGRGRSGSRASGRLHWTRWGYHSARAWGDDWLNNCKPYCAAGTYTGYHANVSLYRREMLGGRKVFTRMRVAYPGGRPPYPFYQHHRFWIARLVWSRQSGGGQFGVYYWRAPVVG